jgi:DsbC/DsbD-like thiol-disulfide interchange protein
MRRPIAAGFLWWIVVAAGMAAQSSAPHARVELLARQNAAAPGACVQLGVHFVLEPGWHIYWTNPGDSGQPPALKWQLPAGFSAGEIRWPRPERMQASQQLADYGYHGEVLLPVALEVPASAAAGGTVEIAAEAKWLVCREVCLPGRSQLHLALPVAAAVQENRESAALFARAEKLLPRPLPVGWKASVKAEKDDFVLQLQAGRRIVKAEFFPLDADQIENAAPQKLEPLPAGARITLRKSEQLLKPIQALRGILVLPAAPASGGGARDGVAYRIEAPVR